MLELSISWVVYILAFLIGVVQTPLIVDLLRALLPTWNIRRLTSRTESILLVTLMTIFALTGLVLQIFYFIPLYPEVPYRCIKIVCHSCFAYWVWINMVINYYYAVFLHPGQWSKPDSVDNTSTCGTVGQDGEARNDSDNLTRRALPQTKVKSNGSTESVEARLGTERHRYCKKCQMTTLYLDHHCPFIGNCVGLNTYSHFFLCLCYGSLGLGYSLTVSCVYFGECIVPGVWRWLELEPLDESTFAAVETFTDLFVPVLGGFLVLNLVIGFQVFLLLSDMTTFEVLLHIRTGPIFRIGWKRIFKREFLKSESRLNILLLPQRRSLWWFLVPVRNLHPCYSAETSNERN